MRAALVLLLPLGFGLAGCATFRPSSVFAQDAGRSAPESVPYEGVGAVGSPTVTMDPVALAGSTAPVLRDPTTAGGGKSYLATDYPDLQTAIDSVPAGGRLYLPAGTYVASSQLTISRSIIIYGDGPTSTYVKPANAGTNCFRLYNASAGVGHVTIRDLGMLSYGGDGSASADGGYGSGHGIFLDGRDYRGETVTLENVRIMGMGLDGIYAHKWNFPLLINVDIMECRRNGIHMNDVAQARLFHTYSHANHSFGFYGYGCIGLQMDGIGIEGNQVDGTNDVNEPQLYLDLCHSVSIQRIGFEAFKQAAAKSAVTLRECRGVVLAGCDFTNADGMGCTGIRIHDNNEGLHIFGNRFRNVGTAIKVSDAAECAAVSNDVFIGWQGYQGTVTARLTLPGDSSELDGKNIVVFGVPGIRLPQYAVSAVPAAAASNEGMIIYVRDGSPGQKFRASTGNSWVNLDLEP
jgi:hypothetical protein